MQSGEIGEFLLLVSVHVVQRDGKIIERFGDSTFVFYLNSSLQLLTLQVEIICIFFGWKTPSVDKVNVNLIGSTSSLRPGLSACRLVVRSVCHSFL